MKIGNTLFVKFIHIIQKIPNEKGIELLKQEKDVTYAVEFSKR